MRVGALLAALVSLVLCFHVARGTLSELYLKIAVEEYSNTPLSVLGFQAADAAARFDPKSPTAQTQIALYQGARGDSDEMLNASRRALSRAPADARLWMQHAYLLVHAGELGPELEATMKQAETLAPSSHDVHLRHALLGLNIWRTAPDSLRQSSLRSMRFLQQHAPTQFLNALIDAREELKACAFVGTDLNLQNWCETMHARRLQCDSADLTERVQSRCRHWNLLP